MLVERLDPEQEMQNPLVDRKCGIEWIAASKCDESVPSQWGRRRNSIEVRFLQIGECAREGQTSQFDRKLWFDDESRTSHNNIALKRG